jgi:hypothetical protein
MRNTVLFLSCLLASLWISIAFADNGVERGSIDVTESQLPSPVKLYLEQLMFSNCDLKGAALIRPSYLSAFPEENDLGIFSMRYKIELQVSYKNSSELRLIYADLVLFQSEAGESRVDLKELSSPLCYIVK